MYSAANQLSEVEMDIIKYKNYPSIKAITDRTEKLGKLIFNFNTLLTRKQIRRSIT